jgi:hypothetical protein
MVLMIISLCCTTQTNPPPQSNLSNDSISVTNITQKDCNCLDENMIFNDTTWFLPYANAQDRDTIRAIFEQWKVYIDEDCEITLTLYNDSTYRDYSPCEWDFAFTGFYQYICDTLYCVRINIDDHSINSYNPPRVICLEKYVRKNNYLKYLCRKKHIIKDKYDIQMATHELVFEKINL